MFEMVADWLVQQPLHILAVAAAHTREFDLIMSGLCVTVPRALVINFTTPTAVEGIYVIASRAAAARPKSPVELDRPGATIAVYAGMLQERLAARRFPKAMLVKLSGDADHLAPVLAGEADATLGTTFAPQVRSGELVEVTPAATQRRALCTSMRSGPSSVSTVLPMAPSRCFLASSGLVALGRQPGRCDSSAPKARSIGAFFNAMDAALTDSALIGPVTSRSISSSSIVGIAAAAATAAFVAFPLAGIHAAVRRTLPRAQDSG